MTAVQIIPEETEVDLLTEVLAVLGMPGKDAVPKPRLITREQYHKMAEAGVFGLGERVELIEGIIVEMAAIGVWHIVTLRVLTQEIVLQLQRRAQIDVQGAIILDASEPQPDLVIVKAGLPGKAEAKDILLVIEVSDTTLRYDQRVKALLYARKNIPEYWIIDHDGDQIIQHTVPKKGKYTKIGNLKRGEAIASTVQPAITLDVAAVLGTKEE